MRVISRDRARWLAKTQKTNRQGSVERLKTEFDRLRLKNGKWVSRRWKDGVLRYVLLP